MTGCIKVTHMRAPNDVAKHASKRMVSADGTRWAIGRKQKRHLANHMFDIVECWTLKQRIDGKVVTMDMHRDEAAAIEFIKAVTL
jgi:hypothetical protein